MLASRWLSAHGEEDTAPSRRLGRWLRPPGLTVIASCSAGRSITGRCRGDRPWRSWSGAPAAAVEPDRSEYVPTEDDGQFTINTEMPPGTSLEAPTPRWPYRRALLGIPEIEAVHHRRRARGLGGGPTDRNAQIAVQLVERASASAGAPGDAGVRRVLPGVPGMAVARAGPTPLSAAAGTADQHSPVGRRSGKLNSSPSRSRRRQQHRGRPTSRTTPRSMPELRGVPRPPAHGRPPRDRDQVAPRATAIGGTAVTQMHRRSARRSTSRCSPTVPAQRPDGPGEHARSRWAIRRDRANSRG